jgi:esterase/lipase superfamily enzyme
VTHQPGELERPWQVFSFALPEDARRHISIADISSISSATSFYKTFAEAIDSAPIRSAFVFVHGYNVSFEEALLRAGQLAFDINFRGPVVAYSWPSKGNARSYVEDIEMADWTVQHLVEFLAELRRATGSRTIHLVAHSMGARVLTRALERLAQVQGKTHQYQEVILAAPDINNYVLSQLSSALQMESERVTIYTSTNDIALRLSAALRGESSRAGGQSALQLKLPFTFDIIDATRVRSSLLGHSYFAESIIMLNDLALLLRERLAPGRRLITLQPEGSIWVFR